MAVARPAPPQVRQAALQAAIASEKLCDAAPVAVFYDLPALRANARALVDAFPPDALHAFALKAAPLPRLLRHLAAAGLGGECASVAELAVCRAAGLPPDRVIFDSPAKTDAHLRAALRAGVYVNADNIPELARIAAVLRDVGSTSAVGLRVNPQLGSATIPATFTASPACKFGEPLNERRADIIAAFKTYPFLTGILVHVGSQGCATDVFVDAARAAVELAGDVTAAGGTVSVIDIGGGMSVDYWADHEQPFDQFAARLRKACPRLFDYRIMTEFGRRLAAKTAFVCARVQHVKEAGGKTYVICHVGADLLMRPVYHPDAWAHRIDVYDARGEPKTGEVRKVDIGGPLCFQGDIIATDREIVMPDPGDYLLVRDAGAYTLSMYSRHTSQLTPAVYAIDDDGDLETIKRQETVDDVVKFWS